ncbi:unnamed protein product [Rotaria socialis]|uniref:Uncharacterized protein n=1 Tax=Rotaria socialis TaxID=392032 RepID=A0A818QQU6_9BILA|nr:unnamed protein product [Rotaria socialis]
MLNENLKSQEQNAEVPHFTENFTELIEDSIKLWAANYPKKKLLVMFQEFIRQLFSGKCRLISLRIDLVYGDFGLYQYFKLNHYLSCSITEQYRASCHTLRRLHIHLNYTYFLEYLIEHLPVPENLNVIFCDSLDVRPRSMLDIENLIKTSGHWFNKVQGCGCTWERFLITLSHKQSNPHPHPSIFLYTQV